MNKWIRHLYQTLSSQQDLQIEMNVHFQDAHPVENYLQRERNAGKDISIRRANISCCLVAQSCSNSSPSGALMECLWLSCHSDSTTHIHLFLCAPFSSAFNLFPASELFSNDFSSTSGKLSIGCLCKSLNEHSLLILQD